jgi:hypothetical protein
MNAETIVREFARQFDTPNTRLMISLCESGRITWQQAEGIATKALRKGLAEVA